MSIGVYSGVPAQGQRLEDAVKRADEALYRAKQTGRNRVVFSAPHGAGDEAACEI